MSNTVRDVSGLNCKGSIGLLNGTREKLDPSARWAGTSPRKTRGGKEG
jgi:hypothetical protein